MRALVVVPAVLALVALPAVVSGQPAHIRNGQVTVVSPAAPLTSSFRGLVAAEAGVAWIGYAVPTGPRSGTSCCVHAGSGESGLLVSGCPLERGTPEGVTGARGTPTASNAAPLVRLEPPDRAYVMFRVLDRQVERIRVFTEGCELDAGGRVVRWLESVRPAESVELLASFVSAGDRRNGVVNGGLSALAMHAAPEATDALIDLARQHGLPAVRGQALFWLGQKAGEKAAAEITARIEDDPDTEVKRRAVFALSQLPPDQGVPLLIKVARTQGNPAVKKHAFFWLGQSKDPRAVEFFAEVLR